MLLILLTRFSGAANARELENLEKVQGGFYISDEQIISLANYIQELQDENYRLLATVDALNQALQDERIFVDKLLAEKDKVIKLQDEQIKDLRFVYESSRPSLFDKATLVFGGAGVAAVILLIANSL